MYAPLCVMACSLQELGKSNPQLLQLINSNQQEFLQLLSQAGDDEGEEGMEEALGALAGAAGGMGAVVELTPEDDAAIQRLQALGFDRDMCIVSAGVLDRPAFDSRRLFRACWLQSCEHAPHAPATHSAVLSFRVTLASLVAGGVSGV